MRYSFKLAVLDMKTWLKRKNIQNGIRIFLFVYPDLLVYAVHFIFLCGVAVDVFY